MQNVTLTFLFGGGDVQLLTRDARWWLMFTWNQFL